MMLLCIVAASAVTHFGGGTANDLAKSIFESTGQNVVIFQAVPSKIEPFDYDTERLGDFAQTMRTKAHLYLVPGTDYIFSDGIIPPSKMPPRYTRRGGGVPFGGGPLPEGALTDRKVTLKTEGANGLAIAALANTTWSKKLDIDPYFGGLAVAAWVKEMPEETFLRWVAKSAGGMLSPINGFHIKVDGVETQRRLVRMVDEHLDSLVKGASRERDELLLAVARQAAPQQIADLAGAAHKEIQVPIQNGSALGKLAIARLTEVDKQQSSQVLIKSSDASPPPRTPSIFQRIDPRQPSYVVLTPAFEVFVDVPLGGRGNNRTRF